MKKIHLQQKVKAATPWNVSIAKLTNLEKRITKSEREALEARWLFGCELVTRRIEYNGRHVIPKDLMALTIDKCKLSRSEINYRVQFALRYPTKAAMSTAVDVHKSWTQMKSHGLIDKHDGRQKKSTTATHSGRWVIRRLAKEVDKAFTGHATLTRDQVQDIEHLVTRLQQLLEQVDRNDQVRAS